MIQYFFDSLMGVLLLSALMIAVIGSAWVLTIAVKELLETIGVQTWKSYGEIVQPKKRLKSDR